MTARDEFAAWTEQWNRDQEARGVRALVGIRGLVRHYAAAEEKARGFDLIARTIAEWDAADTAAREEHARACAEWGAKIRAEWEQLTADVERLTGETDGSS